MKDHFFALCGTLQQSANQLILRIVFKTGKKSTLKNKKKKINLSTISKNDPQKGDFLGKKMIYEI
jgi:hypothetical protein